MGSTVCIYRKKVNELVNITTQEAIMRSRQPWYEEGEKTHDIIFNFEKKQNSNLKSNNWLELNKILSWKI